MSIPQCSECGKPFYKSLLEVRDGKLYCTSKLNRKSHPHTFIAKLYYRFTCEFGISALSSTEQYIAGK